MKTTAKAARKLRLKTLPLAIALASTAPLASMQASASAMLEEVIVTAQKHEESVQDVPIAISAFSGDAIKELGATNVSELTSFTPGLDANNTSSTQPAYNIRGVQTNDFGVGSDPSVAVYIDGVYAARGAGAEVPFSDVERIEVLKGPQGTLFGRNSTGGAIHIITKKPSLEEQTGEISVSAGNYGKKDLDFGYNLPLSDTLALRLSGTINKNDGWQKVINGSNQQQQDEQTLRASVLWQPTEDTEIIWRSAYSDMKQNSGSVLTVTKAVFEESGRNFQSAFDDIALDGTSEEERDMFNTSVEVNIDYENFTFTSISAYSQFNSDFPNDEDGSDNSRFHFHSNNIDDQDQFSQEFRFTGETDKLKWTTGFNYSKEHVDHTTIAEFNRATLDTFAAFEAAKGGQVAGIDPSVLSDTQIAELLPTILDTVPGTGEFTAGFIAGLLGGLPGPGPTNTGLDLVALGAGCNGLGPTAGAAKAGGATDLQVIGLMACQLNVHDPLDQRLWTESVRNTGTYESMAIYGDVTYALTEKMNLSAGLRYTYDDKEFTISTGYQNTIFGLPFGLAFYNSGTDGKFIPKKFSDDWSSVSGRLVLDYLISDDIMVYGSVSTGFKSGGFNSLSFGPNIPASFDPEEVTNYEVGVKSDLLDGTLRVNASAYYFDYSDRQSLDLITPAGQLVPSYTVTTADAEVDGFELEVLWAATDNLFIGGNLTYINAEATDFNNPDTDVIGIEFADTPPKKINLMAQYTVPLNDLGELSLRVDYNWTDDRSTNTTIRKTGGDPEQFKVGDYDLWNARATLNSADDQWAVSAWVHNLTDVEVTRGDAGPGDSIGSYTVSLQPPRTYGVDVTYKF